MGYHLGCFSNSSYFPPCTWDCPAASYGRHSLKIPKTTLLLVEGLSSASNMSCKIHSLENLVNFYKPAAHPICWDRYISLFKRKICEITMLFIVLLHRQGDIMVNIEERGRLCMYMCLCVFCVKKKTREAQRAWEEGCINIWVNMDEGCFSSSSGRFCEESRHCSMQQMLGIIAATFKQIFGFLKRWLHRVVISGPVIISGAETLNHFYTNPERWAE